MYEIFERLMKERGSRASDVAKATGIKNSTFTDWKMGRYTPKADKLQKIADYFGVSLDYLKTGKEPEFTDVYMNQSYFETYLKCIGWNAEFKSDHYVLSNGTLSVNMSASEFDRFESKIRNECIQTIMDYISSSIEMPIAAHERKNIEATDEAEGNDLQKMFF